LIFYNVTFTVSRNIFLVEEEKNEVLEANNCQFIFPCLLSRNVTIFEKSINIEATNKISFNQFIYVIFLQTVVAIGNLIKYKVYLLPIEIIFTIFRQLKIKDNEK
jgi:hypothetical protein